MNSPIDSPTPEYDDPKELYACFGLAFYKANVLERGVLNLAVALMTQGNLGITIDDVGRLYNSFETKTFGQILKIAEDRYKFTEEFSSDLKLALSQRNHLAHGFFKTHDIDHMSMLGRRQMIDELVSIWTHLTKVDEIMDEYWMSAWQEYGISKEWIEHQMLAYISTVKPQEK